MKHVSLPLALTLAVLCVGCTATSSDGPSSGNAHPAGFDRDHSPQETTDSSAQLRNPPTVHEERDARESDGPIAPSDLSEPVDVTRSEVYLDGGTVAVLLTDATGVELPFCIAGTRWEHEAKRNPTVGPRALYLGTLHWRGSGIAPVPPGGPEECAILRHLEDYLRREFSERERDELKRAKRPFVYNPPAVVRPPERGIHAMQILEAVLVLEERCEPSN